MTTEPTTIDRANILPFTTSIHVAQPDITLLLVIRHNSLALTSSTASSRTEIYVLSPVLQQEEPSIKPVTRIAVVSSSGVFFA